MSYLDINLRDVHRITKMSLHDKTVDELKKSSQQTLFTFLRSFDLWTSRAHESYLGVTCHWISDEFCIYDLTLSIIEMGAYKTAGDIVDSIEPLLAAKR